MSFYGSVIDAMSTAMSGELPTRSHRRDLKDFADLNAADIASGVYTMLSHGVQPDGPLTEYLKVMLVGQIELAEDALPSAVEEAEFQMLDDFRDFIDRIGGVQVVHEGFRQSAQVSAPFGFVSGVLRVGPFSISPPPSMGIIPHIVYRTPPQPSTPLTDIRVGVAPDIGLGHEPDYTKL